MMKKCLSYPAEDEQPILHLFVENIKYNVTLMVKNICAIYHKMYNSVNALLWIGER
jgi:hypothetical protein